MGLIDRLRNKRVYFDTNIIIYWMEGTLEFQSSIRDLESLLAQKQCTAITGDITLCESLIKPFKVESSHMIQTYRSFLEESGIFELISIQKDILVQAAFIAGTYSMKTPDAIHIATAMSSQCDVFLTNDKGIRTPKAMEKVLLSELG